MQGTSGYPMTRVNGVLRLRHRVEWERHHGPIPSGIEIHHRDMNVRNWDIENLQAVTRLAHKRIHAGCVLRDGIWHKPCRRCGAVLPVTAEHWYFTREGWVSRGRCRACCIVEAVETKRRRRERLHAA